MNDQLKKRLVGAIVLVALAVIFLPMLLEGDKRAGIPLFGSNVPEPPDSPVTTLDIPLQLPPQAEPAPVVVENAPPVQEPAAAAAPAPAPAAAEPPRAAEPAPAPAAPAAAPTAKPAAPVRQAEVAALPKPAATESWAVQVGSFSDSANATRLRDNLRGKGYPAYVEKVKLSGGVSYRVRVGPVLTRSDAEAIQGKLAKIDQRGIVVPHP